jgi:hypothetical protein
MNYAQILRAIGQAIERLELEKFKLVRGGDGFVVQELVNYSEKQPGELEERRTARPKGREFHYTVGDIQRLEKGGQISRRYAEGLPEPDSLPNMMRAAGTYVDLKSGHLIEITKSDDKGLAIQFQTINGEMHNELLDATELYSIFVRVYLKRADRNSRSESQA